MQNVFENNIFGDEDNLDFDEDRKFHGDLNISFDVRIVDVWRNVDENMKIAFLFLAFLERLFFFH